MNVSEPQARLAVRSVEDLVGLVPFLIGFHPAESLVVMVIEDNQVVVTARVDLAAVAEPGVLADLLIRLFDRFPRADGWFFAYTDDDPLAWQVLADCTGLVGATRLGRLLQVGSARWRADHPDGPIGALDGVVTAVAAQAAVLGLPARASRQALADSIVGPPDAEIDELVRLFDEQSAALAGLTASGRGRALRRLLREPQAGLIDHVRLALLVAEPQGTLGALRSLRRETANEQVTLWTGVVRHSLLSYQVVPLGLLGMAAWQAGEGALQMVCLERIDRIDPETPLAALLDQLNREVVPPGEWPTIRGPLLAGMADVIRELGEVREPGRPASRRGR